MLVSSKQQIRNGLSVSAHADAYLLKGVVCLLTHTLHAQFLEDTQVVIDALSSCLAQGSEICRPIPSISGAPRANDPPHAFQGLDLTP